MKINPVSDIQHIKPRYFKGNKSFDVPQETPQKEESKVNPLYYQALYGINILMPVIIAGKFNNEDFYIEVENDFVKEFLTDKKGRTNKENIDKFIDIYQKIANDYNKLRHERLDIYEEEKHNGLPPLNEIATKDEEDDFLDNLIDCQKLEIINVPIDAYEKAKRYFQLSKTLKGIDISDYDRKMKLIGDIEMYTLNIFEPHNEDIVYKQITKNAKDNDGNIDYALINDMFEAIDGSGFTVSAEAVINILKNLYSKDKASRKEILEVIKKLNSGYFDINSKNDNFIKIMDLCFDKNSKFSPQRASLLFECTDYLATFIDTALSAMPDFEERIDGYPLYDEDEQYNSYDYVVNTAQKILIDYFSEITDAQGQLHPEEPTLEDYIRSII